MGVQGIGAALAGFTVSTALNATAGRHGYVTADQKEPSWGIGAGLATLFPAFMGTAVTVGTARAAWIGALAGIAGGAAGAMLLDRQAPRTDELTQQVSSKAQQVEDLGGEISQLQSELQAKQTEQRTTAKTADQQLRAARKQYERVLREHQGQPPGEAMVGALRVQLTGRSPKEAAIAFFDAYDLNRSEGLHPAQEATRVHGRDTFSAARLFEHVSAGGEAFDVAALETFFADSVDTGGISNLVDPDEARRFNEGLYAELHTRREELK